MAKIKMTDKYSKKGKKNIRAKNEMSVWFIIISIAGIILTSIVIFFSHGDFFSGLFYLDPLDTGMDFFHSIEYTRGRSPYLLFDTLYPPLANLIFYILYRFVPLGQSIYWADTFMGGVAFRGSYHDLRLWQPTMLLFILFIMILAVSFLVIVQKCLKSTKHANQVALCMLFSYGMIYAFERGNIVILSLICSMFFVIYKDSDNKVLKELAMISLAVAAGIKLYPAILGMLLIYDKQYKRAIRCIIYGIVLFILPCFVFHEGIESIPMFLKILGSYTVTDKIAISGYSFDKIIVSILAIIEQSTNININLQFYFDILPKFNYIIALIPLLCGFILSKKWQKSLCCVTSFLLCQQLSVYGVTFLIIPLLTMMIEEKFLNRKNCIPFFTLVLTQIFLPIGDSLNQLISNVYCRYQLCMIILFFYIMVSSIQQFKLKRMGFKKLFSKGAYNA